jgi:hypothetical protein
MCPRCGNRRMNLIFDLPPVAKRAPNLSGFAGMETIIGCLEPILKGEPPRRPWAASGCRRVRPISKRERGDLASVMHLELRRTARTRHERNSWKSCCRAASCIRVRKIFGYPGEGINGVFGALNRAHGKIGFVQARHEEMAAFMIAPSSVRRATPPPYRREQCAR